MSWLKINKPRPNTILDLWCEFKGSELCKTFVWDAANSITYGSGYYLTPDYLTHDVNGQYKLSERDIYYWKLNRSDVDMLINSELTLSSAKCYGDELINLNCLVCNKGEQELTINLCEGVPHYKVQSNHDHPPSCVLHLWGCCITRGGPTFVSFLTMSKNEIITELTSKNIFAVYLGCLINK